ncbi:MAG: pyrroline-5-carboxylate reductase [Acutalibacteraceae bacterium]|nr:pyrroline-5-carboxylate reductase [Acutalibacteraceae bacterium]
MDYVFGFIGAGNMATAIIKGLVGNSVVEPDKICVCDVDMDKAQNLSTEIGIEVVSEAEKLAEMCHIIVLAVKPQNYAEVLEQIKGTMTEEKVIVSIAAGISINYVREQLGMKCPVVRVMPNTPLLLGKGATAICPSENVSTRDFGIVKSMFSLNGTAEVVEEKHMNSIISVNGSSPAYIYMFAKAVVEYAKSQGIDENTALKLFCATLEGSAAMLMESGDDPDTLIGKVCSKGGTTIEAVNKLNENNFCETIKEAMDACTKRAEELGK